VGTGEGELGFGAIDGRCGETLANVKGLFEGRGCLLVLVLADQRRAEFGQFVGRRKVFGSEDGFSHLDGSSKIRFSLPVSPERFQNRPAIISEVVK
jgi:hypothetical protein